jgi:hypothetical protein
VAVAVWQRNMRATILRLGTLDRQMSVVVLCVSDGGRAGDPVISTTPTTAFPLT